MTRLTIAVLDHHVRGYPRDCLRPLIASAPEGTEFLLISDNVVTLGNCRGNRIGAQQCAHKSAHNADLPPIRSISVTGDRATAKNIAIREAKGQYLLMVSSDVIAQEQALPALLTSIEQMPASIISAQLLQENGMRRRTVFHWPSLWREVNLLASLRHFYAQIRKGVLPPTGDALPVPAFHSEFMIAGIETFRQIGPFQEGHRFGCEDVEWCHRARQAGIPRLVLPEARVFKLPPQVSGALPVDVRVGIDAAVWRLAGSVHAQPHAAAFRSIRRMKSLLKCLTAFAIYHLSGRRSEFLDLSARAHAKIAFMRSHNFSSIPPDAESHVRWEMLI